jgi:hypothetical protein
MHKFFRRTTQVIFLVATMASAHAGTLTCVGTVDKLAFHSPGRLVLNLSSMNTPVFVCSTDAEWIVAGSGYTTSPAACKALYATFLAARTTGGTLDYIHFDGDQVPASCTSFPAWTNVNVRYFGC